MTTFTFCPSTIRKALEKSWSGDTSVCFNPEIAPISYGQCAQTAIVVCEVFGGKILKTKAYKKDGTFIRHFYNEISGQRHDFTADQFDMPNSPDYWDQLIYEDTPSSIEDAATETIPGQVKSMREAFLDALRNQ